MRPTQAKYACNRIDQIVAKKVSKLVEKNGIPANSSEDVYVMLKKGILKLKTNPPKDNKYGNCFSRNLDDYFDMKAVRKGKTFTENHQEEIDKLYSEATKIKDEIWLGDESVAAKLIENFSKT